MRTPQKLTSLSGRKARLDLLNAVGFRNAVGVEEKDWNPTLNDSTTAAVTGRRTHRMTGSVYSARTQ